MRRTSFLTASAALVAACGEAAIAQTSVPGGTHLVERRSDFAMDQFAKIVGRPAQIRQMYEAVSFKPAVFNNIKNSMNGLQFGYGYPAAQIAIAMANHGPSAVYGYSNYLWQKYRLGEAFKLENADGTPASSNAFLAKRSSFDLGADPDNEKGMYQDTSIEMLQQRGLIMLVCHTGIEEQARMLVAKGFAPAGMSPSDVADDMLAHVIPEALVVPSMVATIAVMQAAYHYTYISPVL